MANEVNAAFTHGMNNFGVDKSTQMTITTSLNIAGDKLGGLFH